jgi:uncharacterized protein
MKQIRPIRLLVAVAIVLVVFFVIVGCAARKMVFQPFRALEAQPQSLNRPVEDVFFHAADGVRLNGWYFPAGVNSSFAQFAILICHGNAGNISHRLELVDTLLKSGAAVFAFDYRGYGQSEGAPTEKGTYRDAEAAREWLVAKGYAGTNIIALGESLGGGVATELALTTSLAGLILQSTFTSVPDLAGDIAPWLPARLLLTTRFSTREKLARIHVPVLVMHSRADRVIGFAHAERNFAAACPPKFFCELKGDHNDAVFASANEYRQAVSQFLNAIVKKAD